MKNQEVYNFYNDTNTVNRMVIGFRPNNWHSIFRYNKDENDITLLKKFISVNSKVLDFGCGVGETSIILAKDLNCKVTGLNISPKQKEEFDKNIIKNNVASQVSCILYDGENFDSLLPNDFDVITCQESLCHVENKEKIFKKLYNHLKPGGILYIQDWFVTDSKYMKMENIEKSNYYFKTYIESMDMYINYFKNLKNYILEYLDVKQLPNNNIHKMFRDCYIHDRLTDIEKGGTYLSRAFNEGIFTIGIIVLQKL